MIIANSKGDTLKELIITGTTKNEVSGSLQILFAEYDSKRSGIESIAGFVKDKIELTRYFLTGNKTSSFLADEIFELAGAISALNSEYWSKVIEMTDVLECMPADKRNDWSEMIHDLKTPNFEKEVVISTIHNLLLNRDSFLAQKVDALFQKLSGNHVTNSPQGFRKRMIVENVIDSYNSIDYRRSEYLGDLRSIVAKLMGRDVPKVYTTRDDLSSILRNSELGQWHEFDGGALKIKLFKKGTAHLEVHPEIAYELNLILASLYPMALADKLKKKDPSSPKEVSLKKDLISFEVIEVLLNSLDSIGRGRTVYLSNDLKSWVREQAESIFKIIGGTLVKNEWIFSSGTAKTLSLIIRTGSIPEQKSHQFYPTSEALALRLIDLAQINETDTILEPSAGTGGIADHLPLNQTSCVEISEVNSLVLKGKGYTVVKSDFLRLNPIPTYSKIIMNPPFSKGQASSHLIHASKFLTNDGRICAILPASLRGKEIVPDFHHEYSQVIEDAFDGTKVSVVICVLERI
jgi:hypothetical protein